MFIAMCVILFIVSALFGQMLALGLLVGVVSSYVAFLILGMNAPKSPEKPKEYDEYYDCDLPPSKQKNFYVVGD